MRCRDFNRLLNDGSRTQAQRFDMAGHRARCARCDEVWQAERLLRALIVPSTPPTLLERICAFIDEVAAGTVVSFPVRRAIVAGSLFVAAAAAATFIAFQRIDDRRGVSAIVPVVVTAAQPSGQAADEADSVPGDVPGDAGGENLAANDGGQPPAAIPESAEPTIPLASASDSAPIVSAAASAPDDPDDVERRSRDESGRSATDTSSLPEPTGIEAPYETPSESPGALETRIAVQQLTAAAELDAALAIVEGAQGADVRPLIDALLAFGDLRQETGDPLAALESYSRARDLSRRELGVANPDQLEIVERMARSLVAAGQNEMAKNLQLDAMILAQRIFGESSDEAIRSHFRYARWLRDHGDPGMANSKEIERVYGEAYVAIDRTRSGAHRAARLFWELGHEMLIGTPDEILQERLIGTLIRARDVYNANDVDDPMLQATIRRDAGDWGVIYGDFSRIDYAYLQAWESLGGVANGAALRDEWFSSVTLLHAPTVDLPALRADAQALQGRVEIGATVNRFGRAGDIGIVSLEPAGLVDEEAIRDAAIRRVKGARFRPHLVDGELVESQVRVPWTFEYDPERVSSPSRSRP